MIRFTPIQLTAGTNADFGGTGAAEEDDQLYLEHYHTFYITGTAGGVATITWSGGDEDQGTQTLNVDQIGTFMVGGATNINVAGTVQTLTVRVHSFGRNF